MAATKIATCCYCGTKAALVLRGRERHELACSSCGAPLHAMKMLPQTPERAARPAAMPAPRHPHPYRDDHKVRRPRKRGKLARFGRKVLSEIWDEIEDIFD